MKKIILIDGNNLLFRSYFATAYTGNIMKNSKGFPTNGLYGFINMLNKILNEEKPMYVVVAFDKGKTFRHEKYPEYKDGRHETPEELIMQFPYAKKLVEAMGMTYLEADNYEADDIIGTFVKKSEDDEEFDATIISSDKDLLQLISDETDVKLLKPVGFVRMDKEEFINTYGIEPHLMVDLKALMGDSSDNIPGVKGIGEKTALKLLIEYGSLDGIYNNIDSIKGKLQEKLILGKQSAYMSYDLATIYKDVPVDVDFEQIKYKGIDPLKYVGLLEELEFYSLIRKLDIKKDEIRGNVENEVSFKVVSDLKEVNLDSDYAVYLETYGYSYHSDIPLGFGIYNDKSAYYIPFDVLKDDVGFFDNALGKYTYDYKKLKVVLSYKGINIESVNFDLMIAGYILNKNIKDDIAFCMNSEGESVEFYEQQFGTLLKLKMPSEDVIAKNAVLKAKFIYDFKDKYLDELKKLNQYELFYNIEMPLAIVLADMELTGIKIDTKFLKEMGEELKQKLDILTNEIYDLAGEEFNISSPKQLGEILFVKLGIAYPKKIKSGSYSYSTSKEILDKIIDSHPIVEKIEEYRLIYKLYYNYVVGYLNEVKEDGKIHTIFNQTLTRTGRLSSSNPNLQNLPIRIEYGRLIRKAFLPEDDSILLSSDYSQIELRIFAHMANASNLIEAFNLDKDIHRKTASDIFHVSESDVTTDMRRQAKAVNFGILYGISSFGLSEDLGIDMVSAKKFINNYLDAYPGIRQYMDDLIKSAHDKGYVTTIMNRKRNIDELQSKNYMVRTSGERMALNTPIQGSSADILKKAMIEIFNEFNKRNLKSKMLIQVHDELVFNVLKDEEEEVTNIIKDIMENTYKLSVPLRVDINKGNNWYEAK